MEPILAIVIGVLFAISVYLMLQRNLLRVVFGIVLLGNAANLLIFTLGRLTRSRPPLVPEDAVLPVPPFANPLPQALILTAIVISFGLLAFALVLVYRTYQELGTIDSDKMTAIAEAPPHPVPDESTEEGEAAA